MVGCYVDAFDPYHRAQGIAMSKNVSDDLKERLSYECTHLALCWLISRQDGRVFLFTNHDTDIPLAAGAWMSGTYKAATGFTATAIENKSDMTVDNLDVTSILDDDSITIEDIRAGLYDYADVYIFAIDWLKAKEYTGAELPTNVISMRYGKFGECIASPQGYYSVEVRGLTQLLQQQIGELYGPCCRADLFDARCGLSSSAYESAANIASVVDTTHYTVTFTSTMGDTGVAKWFKYGSMRIGNGANAGKKLEIKTYDPATGAIELYIPPGYPLEVGSWVRLLPGCDKTWGTCHDTFHNDVAGFRGEANLPGDDKVYWYPNVG
jgi:uncharacterized phage protein (TIGR02218 family)